MFLLLKNDNKKAVNFICSSGGSGKNPYSNKKAHGIVSVSPFYCCKFEEIYQISTCKEKRIRFNMSLFY